MSDCCLPNLGCLAIPLKSTNVLGPSGATGAAGNGIASESYDPLTGELTLTFTDTTTFTTGDLRGAQGNPGNDGVDGVARLYSNFTTSSAATPLGSFYTVATYPVPINTLVNNGDALVINLRTSRASSTGSCKRKISWNGVTITAPIISEIEMYTASGIYQYNTRVEIVKTGTTTATCNIVSDYDINSNNPTGVLNFTYKKNITGVNFGAINTITAYLTQALANQAVFESMTIDKIKAL